MVMQNRDFFEEYAPILAMVASHLVDHPEWSLELLDVVGRKLLPAGHKEQELSGENGSSGRVAPFCNEELADLDYLDLMAPLAHDLAFWRARKIGRQEFSEKANFLSENRNSIVCFRIDSGKVSMACAHLNESLQKRARLYLNFLQEVVQRFLSESSMVLPIDLDDLAKDNEIPVFSFQKHNESHNFLLPDIDFLSSDFYESHAWSDDVDFSEKLQKAIFVGSTTGIDFKKSASITNTIENIASTPSQRIDAAQYFSGNPRVVFKLPNIVQCDGEATVEYLKKFPFCDERRISIKDQYKFRYLISLDGNGATCARVALSLKGNGILLKYNSNYVLYYFYWMKSWSHFIPISSHADVESVVEQGIADPDLFERIAKNSKSFYRRYLNRDSILKYSAVAINEFHGLFGRDSTYFRNIERIKIEPSSVKDVVSDEEVTKISARLAAIERDPGSVADMAALGHLLARAERLDDALHWVDQAISGDEVNGDLHRLRASILERMGAPLEAGAAIEEALRLCPDDAGLESDYQRISAAIVKGYREARDTSADLLTAIEAGNQVVQVSESLEDIAALAHLLARASLLEEALHWIDQAIARDELNFEYHRFRASILERKGAVGEAVNAIKNALRLCPDDAGLRADYARVDEAIVVRFREKRDTLLDVSEAIVAGGEVVRLRPNHHEDMVALARLFARGERLDDALHWIDQAIERDWMNVDSHRFRASVLERRGALEDARNAIRNALMFRPEDIALNDDFRRISEGLLLKYRHSRDMLPDVQEAIEVGRDLVLLFQDDAEDMAALAQLFARAERLDEALYWIDRAIAVAEPNVEHYRFRASILERKGSFKWAYLAAAKGLELDPDNIQLAKDSRRILKKRVLHFFHVKQ